MINQYKPSTRRIVEEAQVYAQGKIKRDIKCPECGHILTKAYGHEHFCIEVFCKHCKFNDIVDLAMLRRRKQIGEYNMKFWYIPLPKDRTA